MAEKLSLFDCLPPIFSLSFGLSAYVKISLAGEELLPIALCRRVELVVSGEAESAWEGQFY
jgi:hypothetical protein